MTMQTSIQFTDSRDALALVLANRSQFRSDFPEWFRENQHVFAAFCREADRIWNRGRRHYSARTIGEVLRHESALTEQGGDFKLNNVRFPCLARLYALMHPERSGFFEFRHQAGSERAA